MVSTAIGAEGVACTDGTDILMAEEPKDFAAQTIRILQSPELCEHIASAGRRLIETRYDWRKLGGEIEAMVAELVARSCGSAPSPAYPAAG